MTEPNISGQRPAVFLLILTWNAKQTILECLKSVLEIKYDNLRVVVIDNGSTDGTAEALKELSGDRIVVIENKTNLRFARGNNEGIKYALSHNADYLMLINDDVKVDPNMVKELVAVAMTDNRIGIVGPKIYYFDAPDQLWFAGGEVYLHKGTSRHRGIRQMDRGQFNEVADCDYITGCGLMIRRSVVEDIGLLDPTYPFYYEDADWCMRASKAGFRVVYVPRAIMWHKISASAGRLSFFKIWNKLRSGWIFFGRYSRWYHMFTIPLFFTLDTLRVLGLILRGKIKPSPKTGN